MAYVPEASLETLLGVFGIGGSFSNFCSKQCNGTKPTRCLTLILHTAKEQKITTCKIGDWKQL